MHDTAKNERDEFNDALGSLQKASDASRGIVSTYLLVYAAVMLFTLSNFIVPQEQDRIHDMARDLSVAIHCIFDVGIDNKSVDCHRANNDIIVAPEVLRELAAEASPLTENDQPAQRFLQIVQNANTDIYEHRLLNMLDTSADAARFSVPIIGVKVDRNWFAYLNGFGGIFFFMIILHALENQLVLLREILKRKLTTMQRKMVNATQIFTSSGLVPGDFEDRQEFAYAGVFLWLSKLLQPRWLWHDDRTSSARVKQVFLAFLLFLPVLVALLLEFDLLSVTLPHDVPAFSFVVDWLGKAIVWTAQRVFLDRGTFTPVVMPTLSANSAYPDAKHMVMFVVTLLINAVVIVILLGMFARLCRVVGLLVANDARNVQRMNGGPAAHAD